MSSANCPLTQFRGYWIALALLLVHCSLEKGPDRGIRAHTQDFNGIKHPIMAQLAPRYCILCHGNQLQGGQNKEPSCYKCHGQNWQAIESSSRAPSDHTTINLGYHHHPNLKNPTAYCTSCHGVDLQGDLENSRPSCFLCHEQKW